MAADTRQRHQSDDAVYQLRGGKDQRAGSAQTGLGALVEQALGIELAQPLKGERWAGAVARPVGKS